MRVGKDVELVTTVVVSTLVRVLYLVFVLYLVLVFLPLLVLLLPSSTAGSPVKVAGGATDSVTITVAMTSDTSVGTSFGVDNGVRTAA